MSHKIEWRMHYQAMKYISKIDQLNLMYTKRRDKFAN